MDHEASSWLYQEMGQLEEVILAHFFRDDTEISVPILLATKQMKVESFKNLWRDFSAWRSDIQAA